MWRNEHQIFRRKDTLTGKDIFSGIPPHCPLKVYENSYWNSDAFDASTYAREYDFSRPFFEQFKELLHEVPLSSKSDLRSVNSDYSDQSSDFKNAYLCFNGDAVEDSAYCTKTSYSKDCFDLTYALHNELCYDSANTDKSYRVFFSVDIEGSNDIWFSRDLVGCANCVGCAGLRKKSYHILNEPYPKEEYERKLKELRLDTREGLESFRKKAYELWNTKPVRFRRGLRNVDSLGERISDTRNAVHCFNVSNAENVKYCQDVYMVKTTDCYDYSVWGSASQVYDSLTCGEQVDMIKFCYDCYPASTNLEYSIACRSSSNLFGCVGLKKRQYCILNKEYSKEEYEKLVPLVRKHMHDMPYINSRGLRYTYGEFFPIELSPFAYNETNLQDFFPLKQEEAESRGFPWQKQDTKEFATTLSAQDLPRSIHEAPDSIPRETLRCLGCARAYKIIPMEFSFLRKVGIPLPQHCHECRLQHRQQFINPPFFYQRSCMCQDKANHIHGGGDCPNTFETAYAPEKPVIVYCEECYNAEVA